MMMPTDPATLPLRDIHLPDAVSWWPPGPGWWGLGLLIIAGSAALVWLLRRQQNYRLSAVYLAREELARIKTEFERRRDKTRLAQHLSALVRRLSISLFNRDQTASLTGTAWLSFLDQHIEGQPFSEGVGRVLIEAPYRANIDYDDAELIALVSSWLDDAGEKAPMIHFDWPFALLLLPLPLIIRYWLTPVDNTHEASLRVPFTDLFATTGDGRPRLDVRRTLIWLAALAWCLLIIAAMRPQWLGETIEIPISGRDLMLAIDLSGSMKEKDFILDNQRVNRLSATKSIAGEFIDRRVGDRLGLILFGERAYLQTPLTFDRTTVKVLLYESAIGLAGKATAIGDAIGLAVKRLRGDDADSKILILLTDGANTTGAVEPLAAADLAVQEGLKIYTIGIGADEMVVRSLFGSRRTNPSADLDEETLKAIAEKTGGQYFRARDAEQLVEIYQLLDELEPIEKDVQRYRPQTALFYWPLAVALMLTLAVLLLGKGRGGYAD